MLNVPRMSFIAKNPFRGAFSCHVPLESFDFKVPLAFVLQDVDFLKNALSLFYNFTYSRLYVGCASSLLLPGLSSGCSARPPPCSGFSRRGARALGQAGSAAVVPLL